MSSADPAIDSAQAGCQLLLIDPPSYDPARLAGQLDAALAAVGGIAGFVLPVDLADQDHGSLVQRLAPVRAVCAERGTAFLVRDHVGLALEIGADGVHLGDAAGAQAARAALGSERILGASCGRSRDAAMVAGESGADYVGFGNLGRSPGHDLYELLEWWSELFVLPCLAEAATTVGDCAALARAGADFVAAGASVWTDPAGAAAAVRRLREALTAA